MRGHLFRGVAAKFAEDRLLAALNRQSSVLGDTRTASHRIDTPDGSTIAGPVVIADSGMTEFGKEVVRVLLHLAVDHHARAQSCAPRQQYKAIALFADTRPLFAPRGNDSVDIGHHGYAVAFLNRPGQRSTCKEIPVRAPGNHTGFAIHHGRHSDTNAS